MNLSKLKLILHCHCEKATQLASESLERPLIPSERWAMRFHLMICHGCRRAARQIRQLHDAAANMPEHLRQSLIQQTGELSPAARQRIVDAMHREKDAPR